MARKRSVEITGLTPEQAKQLMADAQRMNDLAHEVRGVDPVGAETADGTVAPDGDREQALAELKGLTERMSEATGLELDPTLEATPKRRRWLRRDR